MKFRLKHVEGIGWFVQRYIEEMFFAKWHTIGQHNVGFGLYGADHTKYPIGSKSEALALLEEYKESLKPKKIEYFDV